MSIQTYPEMNEQIKKLLRLDPNNSVDLYAAARIEELEAEIDRLRAELDRLKRQIESHGPEGRNYTNQQVVELRLERERLIEENRKLREERDDAREQAQKYYRKFEDEVAEIFRLQDELQSAQQEIKRLREQRDAYYKNAQFAEAAAHGIEKLREENRKLIEGLRFYERMARGREANDGGRRARTIFAEIGVTVE